MQNKIIFMLLGIIILISVIGSFIFLNKNFSSGRDNAPIPVSNKLDNIEIIDSTKEGAATTATTTFEEKEPAAILYSGPQKPGNVVVFDFVKFAKSGYVVIYENTFEPTGEILGVSSFLGVGEYINIPIVLTRNIKVGEFFTAMLHEDNGDRSFNIADDKIYRDEEENGVFTQVLIQKEVELNGSTTP